MEAKKQIFHNQHEKWCLNVALPFCGKVIRHRAFRQHLVVDAQIRLDRPLEIWADLSPYLVSRNTLVEHFSNSVSLACFASSQEKIFHAHGSQWTMGERTSRLWHNLSGCNLTITFGSALRLAQNEHSGSEERIRV